MCWDMHNRTKGVQTRNKDVKDFTDGYRSSAAHGICGHVEKRQAGLW